MKELKPVVFIVDDDSSVRRSLERFIRSVGLAAKSYVSAQEFLQAGHGEETGCLVSICGCLKSAASSSRRK